MMIDQSQSSSCSTSTLFTDSSSYHTPSLRTTSPSALPKEMEFVEEHNILAADVLCGKDKKCIKHPGSRDFRNLIDGYSVQYQQAKSRQEKMDITKEIFDKLEHHRFLKLDEDQHVWQTLHPLAVRDKIGHALRFSNRKGHGSVSARKKIRRCLSSSSQSTVDSCESRISSSHRSLSPVPGPSHQPPRRAPSAEYYEMVQLAAKMDIREDTTTSSNNLRKQFRSQQQLPSLVCFHEGKGEEEGEGGVLDFSSLDHDDTVGDLSWILQIPLLEVNPKTKKIYFVQQA